MYEKYPFTIENKEFQSYVTKLKEPYRSPSKGGNTTALHAHYITIDGTVYSFLARGSKKFVYKGETISFSYKKEKDNGHEYNDIDKQSIISMDKNGKQYKRGNRTYKPTLRTATQKAPVSKREWRD